MGLFLSIISKIGNDYPELFIVFIVLFIMIRIFIKYKQDKEIKNYSEDIDKNIKNIFDNKRKDNNKILEIKRKDKN